MKQLPFKYTGGKWKLASWIVPLLPEHTRYIEPYGGSAAILLNKPKVDEEIYNDINGDCVNVYRVLRDPETAEELAYRMFWTPQAREEYVDSYEPTDDPIERARRFLIRCGQSFGSYGGARKESSGWVNAIAPIRSKHWKKYVTPQNFIDWHERMREVTIENADALEVIKKYDKSGALIYADPPYEESTWSTRRAFGKNALTDHAELLRLLKQCKASVVISGYDCELYRDELSGWELHTKNSMTSDKRRDANNRRVECLWISPVASNFRRAG